MPTSDEIREGQRATWGGLSAAWERWDTIIQDQLRPVTTAMLERLGIAEDQQHLDIASGTGEPGLTVAEQAPRGHVVLTDLSPEMLAVAGRRAEAAASRTSRPGCAASTTCPSAMRRSTARRCGSATCSSPT